MPAWTTGARSRSSWPPGAPGSRPRRPSCRPTAALTGAPAYVRNGRLDILGVNALGAALYAPVLDGRTLPVNLARFLFLDPRASDFYVDWDKAANDAVAILRGEGGRNPYDRNLSDLVGELATRSEAFRGRWATHNVRLHRTGRKRYRHPMVGDLELHYEALEVPADAGLSIITYTAEPASAAQDALAFLASWSMDRTTQSHQPAATETQPTDL